MAEKIVSPGVFTREYDLSYLSQGIGEIGAVIIGPFSKGPAFVPTVIQSQGEFERIFGTQDGTYYTPYTVQTYLRESSNVTVVRIGGIGGYTQQEAAVLGVSSGSDEIVFGVLFNSSYGGSLLTGFSEISASAVSTASLDFTLYESSSAPAWTYTTSINPSSANYIDNLFGVNPLGTREPYVYVSFEDALEDFQDVVNSVPEVLTTVNQIFEDDMVWASTPWVTSQKVDDAIGGRHRLFRFHTLSAGNASNTEFKISIQDIKPAGTVLGSDYGTFTVLVRGYTDTDSRMTLLESFANVTLDPTSTRFLPRAIGDRYTTINSEGKISEHGDWQSISQYVRVQMMDTSLYPATVLPVAIEEYKLPVALGALYDHLVPTVAFKTTSVTDTTTYSGFDFGSLDNKQYLKPLPSGSTIGANGIFCLDELATTETGSACDLILTGSAVVDVAKRKFSFAFQGGFDGQALNRPANLEDDITAANTQGFDCSSATASGSVAYVRALDALSNPDEFDINLVAMPGIIRNLHPAVVTEAIEMCENRGDCFYIADFAEMNSTIQEAIIQSDAVDSSYVAHYYPWVKIVDVNTNQLISVPPSAVLPAVYAANDRVAAEWYAPAGLNRGGITEAVKVVNRLTHAERDTLYESRVNPIAAFPGQGISAWGQKTCQHRPSALDRVNVRRLLIALKKFVASTSRYLVFEQNSVQTRANFINIVTPYLDRVQQRQGLYVFKVVMDESNNTPDIIDRNILYGQIFIQPTKTAEFIVVDFNIMPTGATFSS